ncbi:MAG: hypothetical protein ACP5TY_05960, partial [Thermodesulforhabdaceae bacterium]
CSKKWGSFQRRFSIKHLTMDTEHCERSEAITTPALRQARNNGERGLPRSLCGFAMMYFLISLDIVKLVC